MAITARGERTRHAFRSAASAVIAEKGFPRTTIAEIAERAGRSTASFYNYYDSKEELLAELAAEFRDESAARAALVVSAHEPLEATLRAAATSYWETYRDHVAELVGVFQVAMVDESFAERWRELRLTGIRTIAAGIEQAQADGRAAGLDPWATAAALGSLFEHFCFVSLAQGGAFSDRAIDDATAIEAITQIWYRTLTWTPPSSPAPASTKPTRSTRPGRKRS